MKKLLILTAVGIFMMSFSLGWAEIPHLINYQGMLTNDSGSPLTGNFNLTFKIYSQSSGGSALWTETQNGVSVEDGLFNVILGSSVPVPLSVFSDTLRYLGITVEPGSELTPRIRLTSVGYAYRAEIADTAFYAVEAVSAETDGDWTISGSNIYSAVAGSVGIGTTNPAAKLDVNGQVNTTASYGIEGNTVLSISDSKNTFVGVDAGANNTDYYNTFVGYEAGYNNEGAWNAFFGQGTGYCNTGGDGNTFIGQLAGYWNTSGQGNTFLGRQAGFSNATGWDNTFLGYKAGVSCSTGTRNVCVGKYAGYSNKTGSRNIFLGYNAGYYEEGANKLYIANGSDTNDVLIYGDFSARRVGIGTTSPAGMLHIENSGDGEEAFLWIETSHPTNWHEAGIRIETPQNRWHLRMDDDTNNQMPDGALGLRSQDAGKEVMTWTEDGYVGINNTNPAYRLDVNGDINVSGSYNVKKGGTNYTHPDYVFESNYELMSLEDLKKYVFKRKCLPNVISAEDVKKNNGFNMDELLIQMLEKIEEQTLYIFQLEERIAELERGK